MRYGSKKRSSNFALEGDACISERSSKSRKGTTAVGFGVKGGVTLAFLCALAGTPIAAQPWRAWNGHEVFPVSEGVWEVVSEIGSGAQQYWCGIGDFAIRQLRTKATQRIYVSQPIAPSKNRPARKSVQFSMTPPPGSNTEPRYSLSVKIRGHNLNAATARNYCSDRVEDVVFPVN